MVKNKLLYVLMILVVGFVFSSSSNLVGTHAMTVEHRVYLPLLMNNFSNEAPAWRSVSSPTGQYLNDVFMLSSDSGWAVGMNGTILEWNNNSWQTMTSPTVFHLYAVCGVSETAAWAVGDWGTILRFNGSEWTAIDLSSITNEYLRDIACISQDNLIVVGHLGTILHWDGAAWHLDQSFPSSDDLEDLAVVSESLIWAFGGGYKNPVAYKWDTISWQKVDINIPPGAEVDFAYAGDFSDADNGWIVGGSENIIRWNGSSLEAVQLQPTMYLTNDVDMLSKTNAWLVGFASGSSNIRQWNGTSWVEVASPTEKTLEAIYMLTDTLGWAVGDGVILKYSRQ